MLYYLLLILASPLLTFGMGVTPGIERLVSPEYKDCIEGKRIALFTNQTGVTSTLEGSVEFLLRHQDRLRFKLTALFAPEHGLYGAQHASEKVKDDRYGDEIPVFSLHGDTRRPTDKMLKNIDVIVIDIQDIGSRSYTYISSVCYIMEEAKKKNITVVVADRPNPINGVVVDGPRLKKEFRSFLGYIDVPYCHGMTIGELALFYNSESSLDCKLQVIPMWGWKRTMSFQDTHLPWVPTSPNIPESTTPLYYPMTGILGELQITQIGIGYTLPFKVIGAPWIEGNKLAKYLNDQKLPGVFFRQFTFKPFSGRFENQQCEGVLIYVSDPLLYQPVSTQYAILGMVKSLYPTEFQHALKKCESRLETFNKVNGTDVVYQTLEKNPYPAWTLRELARKDIDSFQKIRKKYLLPDYE